MNTKCRKNVSSRREERRAIFDAIESGNFKVLKLFYEQCVLNNKNVDIESVESRWHDHNPLHFAVEKENFNIIKYLVETVYFPNNDLTNEIGIKIMNAQTGYMTKQTMAHIAARNESSQCVNIFKLLHSKYNMAINTPCEDGWFPIHATCLNKNINILKYMIDNKLYSNMNIRSQNKYKMTPLMYGCKKRNIEYVRILCQLEDVDILNITDADCNLNSVECLYIYFSILCC